MKKAIVSSVIAVLTLFNMPVMASNFEAVDNGMQMVDDSKISISVQNSCIVVNGAAGYTIEVVSLTGRLVTKVKIESNSQRLELNVNKGCYIVKVENQAKTDIFVRKVTLL